HISAKPLQNINKRSPMFIVKITAKGDKDGEYKATQIKGVASDGSPVDMPSGDAFIFDGATGNLPQVIEANKNTTVKYGTIVQLYKGVDDQGESQWLFSYCCGEDEGCPIEIGATGTEDYDQTIDISYAFP